MALLAIGQTTNLEQSLDRYLTQVLTSNAGLALHLPGVRRFVPPTSDPWVKADYSLLSLSRFYRRQIDPVTFGTHVEGHMGLTICQQARNFNAIDRYRLTAARDTVIAAFPEGGLIDIFDYENVDDSGNPLRIGSFTMNGITEAWVDDGVLSGLAQRVVNVRLVYLEAFTR